MKTVDEYMAMLTEPLSAEKVRSLVKIIVDERDDATSLAQNNLDWFNQLKPDFDAVSTEARELREVLEEMIGHLTEKEVTELAADDGCYECVIPTDDLLKYWQLLNRSTAAK
jgi:hypothetical protein